MKKMAKKIQKKQLEKFRADFLDIYPSEAADIIMDLPENDRTAVFRLLPQANAASTFHIASFPS